MFKLKTSHRISLYITLFVGLLTALFFVVLNVFFFLSWYQGEPKWFQDKTNIDTIPEKEYGPPVLRGKQIRWWQERIVRLPLNITGWQDEPDYYGISNIRRIDDRWWMIVPSVRSLVLIDITQNINRQEWLIFYTVLMWISIVIVSFILSHYVVRVSLQDIAILSSSVKGSDITTLSKEHYFDHLPDDDEINTIADAINTMKRTIHDQVLSLKQFLAFASHELKTPLMVIQSSAEAVKYTQDYENSLLNIQHGVKTMQHIIDQLNLFVKLDGNVYREKSSVNVSKIVRENLQTLEKLHANKHITFNKQLKEDIVVLSYVDPIYHIISNLLDNAFKYVDESWTIDIRLDESWLVISNTGPTISSDNLVRIREPFWQQDKNNGSGSWLGLAIVKRSLDYLWWTIQVQSENNLTTFTIRRLS